MLYIKTGESQIYLFFIQIQKLKEANLKVQYDFLRFNVTGAQGEILYWAKENSSCCDRFWCGNVRSDSMSPSSSIYDFLWTF